MNSETYASDYTQAEQALDRWQGAPPVLHLQVSDDYADLTTERKKVAQDGESWSVRYVRSDLFDAKAAELAEALQLLKTPPRTDLQALDAARTQPHVVYMVVEATAHGGRPWAFQYSEEDARLMAELYSADYPGARFDVRPLQLGTITLDLSGGGEEDAAVVGDTHKKWKTGDRRHG